MGKIGLQEKVKIKGGRIELYWFENRVIGIEKTLFHRIYIALEPFDSGLDYGDQPVETEIVMEWLNLGLDDPTDLDGLKLSSSPEDETEVSINIGTVHNPCDIRELALERVSNNLYEMTCVLFVEFESQRVAENEVFTFRARLELDQKIN